MERSVKLLFMFVFVIILTGCRTSRLTSRPVGNDNVSEIKDSGPVFLFVSGTIVYDSLTNTHHIKISQQQKFPGKLNLVKARNIKEPKGLNYVQIDAENQPLSRHEMDNPLIQRMEYIDGNEFSMKTVIKHEAEFYLRLQLDPKARKLQFCNNQEIIETIIIDQ